MNREIKAGVFVSLLHSSSCIKESDTSFYNESGAGGFSSKFAPV